MNAIIDDLQTLVESGVLNSVIVDDRTKISPLDRDWPGFPSAVVFPPILSSADYEDQQNNLREYTWYIMVVTTPENMPLTDPTYLAGLVDNVCTVFDMDATLQGTANGAVLPAVLEPPGPISSKSITYVLFTLQMKAKQLVPAGVQTN
jgi:hypothetical protein